LAWLTLFAEYVRVVCCRCCIDAKSVDMQLAMKKFTSLLPSHPSRTC
jgi:hypothetical protein